MRRRTILKLVLVLLLIAGVGLFFGLGLDHHLTLSELKSRKDELVAAYEARPLLFAGLFFIFYVMATAFSFPGAAVLTMASGAIFGFWIGVLIDSFASTIGASLAFLSSRYLLRDWVRRRFGRRAEAIDRGVERDGKFYLLSLRLIPAFPFFLVNIAMGLTAMRLAPYYLISQIGMLPGTMVYVNAGRQLGSIHSLGDVLSLRVIGALVLLALVPIAAKAFIGGMRRRQIYSGYRKPTTFDRNLIVVGAGAGGLVSAYLAANFKAKVTLIEAGTMGGDCLNTGCVPSKALIRSARAAHEIRRAEEFGLKAADAQVDFKRVMERVRSVIREIAPADSVERYESLGVDVRKGFARLVDPWTVVTDRGDRLTARSIILATGGEPVVPKIPGIEQSAYLTSDTMWDALSKRDSVPERLVIIGGGPIGTEMAQAFARLGSTVTLVEEADRILSKEDEDVSAFVAEVLRSDGVEILTGHRAARFEKKQLIATAAGRNMKIPFDDLILAIGRKARLRGYGLENLGIETDKAIVTNEWLETLYPNIYAVGDVSGPYQFTHFAAHQAGYAVINALFGSFKRFRADYSVLPWTTFTDPEVAHVGHNELSAKEARIAFEVVRYDLGHLDRAITDGANRGFVKILTKPGSDRILGATIVAAEAGELLAELVLAMRHGIGLKKILSTIHAYPTLAEANRHAAGEWRKTHKPERLLNLAERYHAWRRG